VQKIKEYHHFFWGGKDTKEFLVALISGEE
jgi:hypothetical protein